MKKSKKNNLKNNSKDDNDYLVKLLSFFIVKIAITISTNDFYLK